MREASCREAVFSFTACMRGQPNAKMPPNRIITRAQYADETRAQAAASQNGGSADDKRKSEIIAASLRLLAFLPENVSQGDSDAEADIAGVAAYYHHGDKAITVISDSIDVKPLDGETPAETERSGLASALNTLSHEYRHALQDQREDLGKLDDTAENFDDMMAINSLVEGEATLVSDLVTQRTFRKMKDEDWLEQNAESRYTQMLESYLETVVASPAPFNQAELVLPYPVGALPLSEIFLDEGRGGVDRAYKTRPHTLTGWVDPAAKGLGTSLSCGAPAAPSGYELFAYDHFGATGLIALFTRLGLDGVDSFSEATAWRDDRFAIYAAAAPSTATAMAWRIRMKDETKAAQLESAVKNSELRLDVTRTGQEVLLTGASDPSVLDGWTSRTACSMVKGIGAEEEPTGPILPRPPHRFQHRHAASFVHAFIR